MTEWPPRARWRVATPRLHSRERLHVRLRQTRLRLRGPLGSPRSGTPRGSHVSPMAGDPRGGAHGGDRRVSMAPPLRGKLQVLHDVGGATLIDFL